MAGVGGINLSNQRRRMALNLKTAVKGDQNGAGAQHPKRFWADAPFSIPRLPFLGSWAYLLVNPPRTAGLAELLLQLRQVTIK
jgi:hypothetical protein